MNKKKIIIEAIHLRIYTLICWEDFIYHYHHIAHIWSHWIKALLWTLSSRRIFTFHHSRETKDNSLSRILSMATHPYHHVHQIQYLPLCSQAKPRPSKMKSLSSLTTSTIFFGSSLLNALLLIENISQNVSVH